MRWITLVMLAGCSSSMTADDQAPPGDDGGGGEPAGLVGITSEHNRIRMMTGASLAALVWDDALAQTAAAWVAQCKDADGNGLVDHNPDRSTGHPYYVGENTYASSGLASGLGAVDAWAGELAHYHYDTNTCDAGQDCGHYTQIVWRDTLALGCALATCSGLAYPNTIVCDYGPGGNVNGARPY